jgi:hypothetical protein
MPRAVFKHRLFCVTDRTSFLVRVLACRAALGVHNAVQLVAAAKFVDAASMQ